MELPASTLAAMKNKHGFVIVHEHSLVSVDLNGKLGCTAKTLDKLLSPLIFKSFHQGILRRSSISPLNLGSCSFQQRACTPPHDSELRFYPGLEFPWQSPPDDGDLHFEQRNS